MTTYRPYTKEDKLEVGTKIRLGGREGRISVKDNERCVDHVSFIDGGTEEFKYLELFPELFVESKPLTIDKRVKERLLKILTDTMWGMEIKPANVQEARDFLNSLEEV